MKRLGLLAIHFAAIAALAIPCGAQTIESPRLRALDEAIGRGSAGVVDAFWRDVAATSTPLIERTDENKTYALVTFLWRGDEQTKNVLVGGGLGQLGSTRPADSMMTRLRETNVWYRSYWLRKDARTAYGLGPNVTLGPNGDMRPEDAATGPPPDPFNSKRFATFPDDGPSITLNVFEMPNARPESWLTPDPNVKKGTVEQHAFTSKSLQNVRDIWVYTPPDYGARSETYPFLVTTDGGPYTNTIPTPTILDNLIASKKIPPVVAVFVGNAQGARSRELACSKPFVDFLVTEVLPWARTKYTVTSDPSKTVLAGLSFGGLTAACAALQYPNLFGNVLSQSGSFWWKPPGDEEGEWVSRQFASRPKLPLRWFMSVGLLEASSSAPMSIDWQSRTTIPYAPTMLVVNRHLRDVLKAKGYEVDYLEVGGAHNALNWRGHFGDALIALFGAPTASTAQ